MSNFEQVSDVLSHHKSLHQKLNQYYSDLSKKVSNPRASMLLQTLVGHEEKMTNELANYQSQASENLLGTFFQYTHEHDVESLFELPCSLDQLTADDVFDVSYQFDGYLADFYDEMIEVAEDIPDVRALFVNLREQIERERKRLSIDMTGMLDM